MKPAPPVTKIRTCLRLILEKRERKEKGEERRGNEKDKTRTADCMRDPFSVGMLVCSCLFVFVCYLPALNTSFKFGVAGFGDGAGDGLGCG